MSIPGRIPNTATPSPNRMHWLCFEWFPSDEYAVRNELLWTRWNPLNVSMPCLLLRISIPRSGCICIRSCFSISHLGRSIEFSSSGALSLRHSAERYIESFVQQMKVARSPFVSSRDRFQRCPTGIFARVTFGACSSHHWESSHLMDASWRSYFATTRLSRKHPPQQFGTANRQLIPTKQITIPTRQRSCWFLCR